MALLLTEDQAMLRDTARAFIEDKSPVAEMRRLRDSRDADGFSRDLWAEFAAMGFTGILVPEAHGGLGLGMVEAGVVMEELGRQLVLSPFLSSAVLCATALVRGGSDAQQARWLPAITAGQAFGALALEEGGKHRPERTALRAERSGNGFRLSGDKSLVLDGHVADLLVVVARTSGKPGDTAGLTLFVVDAKTDGLATEPAVLVDSRRAARLLLNDVQVDADAVLGEVDGGWGVLEPVLEVGRAAVAAELVGVGGQAFERTVHYLKERRQFGRLIGEFQALQHRAAHLYSELEVARGAVLKALQVLDSDSTRAAPYVAVAKAKAGQASALAVREGVQMHGGMGMTDAFDIGLYMKRQRVSEELFGDAGFHADRLARLHGY